MQFPIYFTFVRAKIFLMSGSCFWKPLSQVGPVLSSSSTSSRWLHSTMDEMWGDAYDADTDDDALTSWSVVRLDSDQRWDWNQFDWKELLYISVLMWWLWWMIFQFEWVVNGHHCIELVTDNSCWCCFDYPNDIPAKGHTSQITMYLYMVCSQIIKTLEKIEWWQESRIKIQFQVHMYTYISLLMKSKNWVQIRQWQTCKWFIL